MEPTKNKTDIIDEEREEKFQRAANDAYFKLGVDAISLAITDKIGLLKAEQNKTQEYRDGYSAAILTVYRVIANARFLTRLGQCANVDNASAGGERRPPSAFGCFKVETLGGGRF